MGNRIRYAGALAATTVLLLGSVMGCPFHAETFVRHCAVDTDCDDGIECTTDKCVDTVCSITNNAAHTPCSNGGVCDGMVTCLGCLTDVDCMMYHSTSPVCDMKTQTCVSCSDGMKNGNETGVDCGGPDCGACLGNPCKETDAGASCGNGNVCDETENVCCSSPCDPTITNCITCSAKNGAMADGTCGQVSFGQDPFKQCSATGSALAGGCGMMMGKCACEDGQVDGKETDKDCGGGVCPGCAGGQACAQDSDCAMGFCINEACCNTACGLPCKTCDSAGDCVDVPAGASDPSCAPGYACAPNAGCVGRAGVACGSNMACLSQVCTAKKCAKSVSGHACSDGTDCVSGVCQNFICM